MDRLQDAKGCTMIIQQDDMVPCTAVNYADDDLSQATK